MEICKIREEHRDEIAATLLELHVASRFGWARCPIAKLESQLGKFAAHRSNLAMFCKTSTGEVGGIVLATRRSHPLVSLCMVELYCLYVLPDHRRSMIGPKLAGTLFDWAQAIGATEIAYTDVMGGTGRYEVGFLKRLGFNEIDKVMRVLL
jgi:GNAT superfamily N-acetyltransferase